MMGWSPRAGPRLLAFLILSMLAACSTERSSAPLPAPVVSSAHKGGPGQIVAVASWYGPGFNGHRTSSGAIYDQDDLTAASTLFPIGSRLLVTNPANRRSVEVLINDHGPYVNGRQLDLSHRAASTLGIVKPGTAPVLIDILRTPPDGPPLGLRYFVQVGSFADPLNARRIGGRLANYYPDVRVVEVESGENSYYRVRMGAFMDPRAARKRAAAVSSFGFKPVIITE